VRTSIGLVALLSFPAAAAAQTRHSGFVGQLQLGLGWCTDDACSESNVIDAQYETGLSVGMFLGYRFPTPYVSIGANWQYSMHPVDDEVDWVDDASAYSAAFDFGARVHPLVRGKLDPWFGLGLGYAFAGSSWDNSREAQEESTSLGGPAFALSAGGDFWIDDRFAVGLALRYMFVFWNELCVDTVEFERVYSGDTCKSPDDWEDDRLRYPDRSEFDKDDLPNLAQILVTGTFAP
jgi:hypothetical protein